VHHGHVPSALAGREAVRPPTLNGRPRNEQGSAPSRRPSWMTLVLLTVDGMDAVEVLEDLEHRPGLPQPRRGMVAGDYHHRYLRLAQPKELLQGEGDRSVGRVARRRTGPRNGAPRPASAPSIYRPCARTRGRSPSPFRFSRSPHPPWSRRCSLDVCRDVDDPHSSDLKTWLQSKKPSGV